MRKSAERFSRPDNSDNTHPLRPAGRRAATARSSRGKDARCNRQFTALLARAHKGYPKVAPAPPSPQQRACPRKGKTGQCHPTSSGAFAGGSSMRHLAAVVLASLLGAGPAAADVLGDWTDIAFATAATAQQPAYVQSRTLAMVHVAMFETLNAVDARYAPYKVKAVPSLGTSAEAAAAVAAHDVLVALFPAQATPLDASLDISLVYSRSAYGRVRLGSPRPNRPRSPPEDRQRSQSHPGGDRAPRSRGPRAQSRRGMPCGRPS